jgi:hypothetical protein
VANRGEDVNGDGKFTPGPPFEDINHDGIRQYDQRLPVENSYLCLGHSDTIIGDLNRNNFLDPIEPLKSPEYMAVYHQLIGNNALGSGSSGPKTPEDVVALATLNRLDSIYTEQARAVGGFDIDVCRDGSANGIADPNTAVSITRTVQTKDGKALNKILYGQSDARRIEVMFWAESQGAVTESPAKLILPVIGDKKE